MCGSMCCKECFIFDNNEIQANNKHLFEIEVLNQYVKVNG